MVLKTVLTYGTTVVEKAEYSKMGFEKGNDGKIAGLKEFFKKIINTGYVYEIKEYMHQPNIKVGYRLRPGAEINVIEGLFNAHDRAVKFRIVSTAIDEAQRQAIMTMINLTLGG